MKHLHKLIADALIKSDGFVNNLALCISANSELLAFLGDPMDKPTEEACKRCIISRYKADRIEFDIDSININSVKFNADFKWEICFTMKRKMYAVPNAKDDYAVSYKHGDYTEETWRETHEYINYETE